MSGERLTDFGLTLSGGGVGGGGAMVGFLGAVELFLGSHSVTSFGSYSGVSAGSIVATYLAAGYSPLEMIQATFHPDRTRFEPWKRTDIMRPNLRELPAAARRLARAAARRLGRRATDPRGPADDEVLGLLPSALMRSDGLERRLRRNLDKRGVRRLSDVDCRLSVTFYDVLANTRMVAGNGVGEIDIDLVDAVLASSAIPGVFPPRRIMLGEREVLGVDGGTGGNTLAVRDMDGLDLLLAYNHASFSPVEGRVRHASAAAVLSLSRQLLLNQRNIDEVATWMDRHPTAHAWVFEPPPQTFVSMFSYSALISQGIACFHQGLRWLREHFDYFSVVLADHGVTVDPHFDRIPFAEVKARGAALKA